jgi:P-type E1-E2 ATPase
VVNKTGTLTFGRAEVQAVLPALGVTERELLETAASAELRSEHPLGKAIVAYVVAAGLSVHEPQRFDYIPGRGIAASLNSCEILTGNRALLMARGIDSSAFPSREPSPASYVFIARDSLFLGAIAIGDTVRPEAGRAISSLRRIGIRSILLTGDTRATANVVGAQLGIDQIEAELLPDAKVARIKQLVADGNLVAMIGDGINDSPALAESSVGIAMGSGTDLARESGDVILLGNDLAKFTETLQIARTTRRIIWQNFYGTIVVDAAGIALAAAGLLSPTLAAFIHVASEMTFILNSARLLPRSRPQAQIDRTSFRSPAKPLARAA